MDLTSRRLTASTKPSPAPDRPLGIVLMRLRVAEIDQNAIAHVLGDKAIEAPDGIRDGAVICADDLAQILGIEPRRQRHRADQIAEHDGELSAFGFAGGGRRRACCCGAEGSDRVEQPPAMPDQGDAEILQILGRQAWQDPLVDLVLAEDRHIALKAQILQPRRYVHAVILGSEEPQPLTARRYTSAF